MFSLNDRCYICCLNTLNTRQHTVLLLLQNIYYILKFGCIGIYRFLLNECFQFFLSFPDSKVFECWFVSATVWVQWVDWSHHMQKKKKIRLRVRIFRVCFQLTFILMCECVCVCCVGKIMRNQCTSVQWTTHFNCCFIDSQASINCIEIHHFRSSSSSFQLVCFPWKRNAVNDTWASGIFPPFNSIKWVNN